VNVDPIGDDVKQLNLKKHKRYLVKNTETNLLKNRDKSSIPANTLLELALACLETGL
jgi:hypothetical protein